MYKAIHIIFLFPLLSIYVSQKVTYNLKDAWAQTCAYTWIERLLFSPIRRTYERTGFLEQGPINTVCTQTSLMTSTDSNRGRKKSPVIPSLAYTTLYPWHVYYMCGINSRSTFEVVIKFCITFIFFLFSRVCLFLMNFSCNCFLIIILHHLYCYVKCQVFHNHSEKVELLFREFNQWLYTV